MTNNFDIHEWRMQQALRELNEKLDAVGKEDSDINNDGKVDKTDKYLHNKRSAIAKNMKEQPAKMVHDAEDLEEDSYSLTEDDWMQRDDESDMAHSQLYAVKDLADKLCNMINDGEQLDAWVQSKLTKAEDYLNSVYRYLSGEENEMNHDHPEMPRLHGPEQSDVILGAQFYEGRGDTDYRRAKAAKRFGKKGEKNTFGAGVAKGEKIEKAKLARRK
jgi:hypothetical protein